jgi:hypothetical protein
MWGLGVLVGVDEARHNPPATILKRLAKRKKNEDSRSPQQESSMVG